MELFLQLLYSAFSIVLYLSMYYTIFFYWQIDWESESTRSLKEIIKPHIHLLVEHTLLLLFIKPSLLAYFIIAILVDIFLIKTEYYQHNLIPCLVRLIANIVWSCLLLLGILTEQAIYIVLIVEMFIIEFSFILYMNRFYDCRV